jgi:hypothetical protein
MIGVTSCRFWMGMYVPFSSLTESHGERDAARVMAKVLGAVKDHGQEAVGDAVLKALKEGRVDLLIGFVIIPKTQEYPHNTCEK